MRIRARVTVCLVAGALALGAGALRGQDAGRTGAAVLQLPAGARAAALSGAYSAAAGDADVLFYNPAGAAALGTAVSASYLRHVLDIRATTAAGAVRLGPLTLGAATALLDAGEVRVVEPDPQYGGERGRETGERASASESATRLAVALPLRGGRIRLGAAAGYVSSDIAGAARAAAVFDLGAQLALERVTLGAALRNLGGALAGDGLDDADLPTEARAGLRFEAARAATLGATLSADLVSRAGGGTWLAAGVEAGLLPAAGRIGAVGRIGWDGGAGDGGLGGLRLGAGLSLGEVAVDYAYQDLDLFGPVHHIGVRWRRAAR